MTTAVMTREPEIGGIVVDRVDLNAQVVGIVNRHPAVGFALGVVRDGSFEFFGHGLADIASNTPITQDTVFRIASITKTFTAIAVMQLWERGLIDLDAPANDYLRAYKLIPAKASYQPATVRHLLTHTAGIAEVLHPSDLLRPDWGDSVDLDAPMPSLADFYRHGLPIDIEPGTTFTYTNHGVATLGQIVEDVSGMPFDRYLREHLFEPLGMVDTDFVRSESVKSRLATGYTLGPTGPNAVIERDHVTGGASNIFSTTRDMARYIAALLGGGANEHGSILMPATLANMFEPHYQPDPRVPGIGLVFDRNSTGGHRLVGHGGILPGFNSQLFVAPDDGVGVIAWTNGATQAMLWLPTELSRLLNLLLGVQEDAVRTDVPQHPQIWKEICGRYELTNRLLDIRARLMLGAGAQVFVRGGQLALRLLTPIPAAYKGFPLHPDDEKDPYVFRIDLSAFGLPTTRIVFSREEGLGATAVRMDLAPFELHKRPAPKGPSRWKTAGLAALLVGTTAIAVRRRGSTAHAD